MAGGQRADRCGEWADDQIVIAAGTGVQSSTSASSFDYRSGGSAFAQTAELDTVQAELKVLLAETAAWRACYRRMNIEEIRKMQDARRVMRSA